MLSVGLIPIVRPRVHYVDIDLHWGWFIVVTIARQLFAEFFHLQLPTLDFDLLEALRELAIGQAKALHYRFEHPLAADSCDFNTVLADLHARVCEPRDWRELAGVREIRLANAVTIAARTFWIWFSVMVIAVTAGIFGFTSVTLNATGSDYRSPSSNGRHRGDTATADWHRR